jgi:Tyrosine phosphatase family
MSAERLYHVIRWNVRIATTDWYATNPRPRSAVRHLLGPAPAPLAGMPYPSPRTPWQHLAAAGFRHVICLESHGPAYDPSPLTISHRTTLQDLYGSRWPRHPEQEERRIHEAVQAAVTRLQTAEGVVVHCAGGTGRTGTVIGCVLRTLGFSAGEAIAYLNSLHQARGRSGWPESVWQSEVTQRFPGLEGIWSH